VKQAKSKVQGTRPDIRRTVPQIQYRSTSGHWPGLNRQFRDNWVAKFGGYLKILRTGLYHFWTMSDDGSWLLINGHRVVNNDDLHGMRERQGRMKLRAGQSARITVWFFERGGGAGLKVHWSGPGFGKRSISRRHVRIKAAEICIEARKNNDQPKQKWIPFKGRYIKMFPKKWYGSMPTMRFELFGKACAQCADSPIGIGAYIIDSSHFKASSVYKQHTAARHGRLSSPGGWTSLPLFQCDTATDRCHWSPKWFWSDTFKTVPDDKYNANPAQVLSSNLNNPYCHRPKRRMRCVDPRVTTKPYDKPLIRVKRISIPAASKSKYKLLKSQEPLFQYQLCLTKYALQLQDSINAKKLPGSEDPLGNSHGAKDLQASDEDFTSKNKAEHMRAQRNSKFKSLVQKVKETGAYLLPAQYSSQYLQIDLCSLLEDKHGCADTGLEKMGKKSAVGCSNAEVLKDCPSCACKPQYITAIATQGSSFGSSVQEEEWVSGYLVSYLMHGEDGKERWKFYSEQGPTHLMTKATVLPGGSSKDDVRKNFLAAPVLAKAIRIHPTCFYGRAISLRVELFQCLNDFSWKGLEEEMLSKGSIGQKSNILKSEVRRLGEGRRGGRSMSTQGSFTISSGNRAGNSERQLDLGSSQLTDTVDPLQSKLKSDLLVLQSKTTTVAKSATREAADLTKTAAKVNTTARGVDESATGQPALPLQSTLQCTDILKATASAFEQWTLGMGGSGAIYQTAAHEIKLGNKKYVFHAYQRRVVSGAGLLQKQLVCYVEGKLPEACCVGKSSKALAGTWPQQSLETKLM